MERDGSDVAVMSDDPNPAAIGKRRTLTPDLSTPPRKKFKVPSLSPELYGDEQDELAFSQPRHQAVNEKVAQMEKIKRDRERVAREEARLQRQREEEGVERRTARQELLKMHEKQQQQLDRQQLQQPKVKSSPHVPVPPSPWAKHASRVQPSPQTKLSQQLQPSPQIQSSPRDFGTRGMGSQMLPPSGRFSASSSELELLASPSPPPPSSRPKKVFKDPRSSSISVSRSVSRDVIPPAPAAAKTVKPSSFYPQSQDIASQYPRSIPIRDSPPKRRTRGTVAKEEAKKPVVVDDDSDLEITQTKRISQQRTRSGRTVRVSQTIESPPHARSQLQTERRYDDGGEDDNDKFIRELQNATGKKAPAVRRRATDMDDDNADYESATRDSAPRTRVERRQTGDLDSDSDYFFVTKPARKPSRILKAKPPLQPKLKGFCRCTTRAKERKDERVRQSIEDVMEKLKPPSSYAGASRPPSIDLDDWRPNPQTEAERRENARKAKEDEQRQHDIVDWAVDVPHDIGREIQLAWPERREAVEWVWCVGKKALELYEASLGDNPDALPPSRRTRNGGRQKGIPEKEAYEMAWYLMKPLPELTGEERWSDGVSSDTEGGGGLEQEGCTQQRGGSGNRGDAVREDNTVHEDNTVDEGYSVPEGDEDALFPPTSPAQHNGTGGDAVMNRSNDESTTLTNDESTTLMPDQGAQPERIEVDNVPVDKQRAEPEVLIVGESQDSPAQNPSAETEMATETEMNTRAEVVDLADETEQDAEDGKAEVVQDHQPNNNVERREDVLAVGPEKIEQEQAYEIQVPGTEDKDETEDEDEDVVMGEAPLLPVWEQLGGAEEGVGGE